MRILVTGANGFIGKNLLVSLRERAGFEILTFVRGDSDEMLVDRVAEADAIIHLAGVNRPTDVADFARVNTDLTLTLCRAIEKAGRPIPVLLASSTQVDLENCYGQSKRAAEKALEALSAETDSPVIIYRLPNVFGKWCKPNYNSVVATFCHNVARDLPIHIDDPSTNMHLVYIDDVVAEFIRILHSCPQGLTWGEISPVHFIKLGDLAQQIRAFKNCRKTLMLERVGTGLTRALYSTFVSYLSPELFTYQLKNYRDQRGIFVEFLKSPDCGQFSFFTVSPGMTRGSHYHHSKTEKFLLIKGKVRMRFRHLITEETCEFTLSQDDIRVVDSIPGWVHDITNIGNSEAVLMLWANEVFDKNDPDCIPCEV